MSDSMSTPFNTLAAGWKQQQALLPSSPNAIPAAATVPAAPVDQVALSANASPTTAATVLSPEDVRKELSALQGELLQLNQKIETLMSRLDTPLQVPTPESTAVTTIPGGAPSSENYDVKAGDYLWKIAREQLGDASRWTEIYALNRDIIGDNPNLIQPGQKFRLPRASTSPAAPTLPTAPVPPPNSAMPPLPPVGATPPQLPASPVPLPPAPPVAAPPPTQVPLTGTTDIPVPPPTPRNLSDQEALRLAIDFGLMPRNAPLTPSIKENVSRFLDEMDAYQNSQRGKVFGPGIEEVAGNPSEVQQIRDSVRQIQQALDLLIKAGKLRVNDAQGRPIQGLAPSGSFFKLDAQGREQKDPGGNPVMDEAFIQAIVRFKQDQGIHQTYKMPDGTWAVNEYVGPGTVEALKKALLEIQAR
ncbi:MAG: LysM peptidoglycan-binding domain-containing protein [Candidatus Sericytochromatia bacterium]|nr:LysM peptidoglycan-binding domain-containing protein [Candidatus Sericytochromatia bacterium]